MGKPESPEKKALEMILPLYESLFDSEQRGALLASILERTGGSGAIWFSADDDIPEDNFIAFVGEDFDPDFYMEHVFELDGWHEMTTHFRAGDTMHLNEEFNRRAFGKTDWFNEFHLPVINAAAICTAIIDPKISSHFSIYRAPGDAPFSDETVQLWNALNPHLRNWARLYTKIGKIEHGSQLLSDTLNTLTIGIMVVDDGLHLIEMNVAAESVLKRNGALSISRKTLRCHVQNDTNLLHALVQAASRTSQGNGIHPGGALRVTSRKGEPLDIMVSPLRRESANGFRRGHVMILISDPASNRCARSDALHAIYGLTPAEAEVADLLVRQKSVNEISEIRGATMATVRTQIKSVLSKADVNKQSEFIKSVAWMDAVIPGPSLKES